MSQLTPFREQALQQYNQQAPVTVLPKFVSLRLAGILWLALAICLVVALLCWSIQLPSYTTVTGVVQGKPDVHRHLPAEILVFVPATAASQIKVGAPVQLRVGKDGPQFSTTVDSVLPETLSPDAARQRYGIGIDNEGVITEPSIAVIVATPTNFSLNTYSGSIVTAQVQAGTQPVFALLPGLNSLMGGSQ